MKDEILSEIKRCAAELDGRAPGRRVFESMTGIRESEWLGIHWVKWSDAVIEAGFEPNELQARYTNAQVLGKLADYIRLLGHFPSTPELRIRRRQDSAFPSDGVYERFGLRDELVAAVCQWCESTADYEDVAAICKTLLNNTVAPRPESPVGARGFVYLIKSGNRYKIGQTLNLGRRTDEVIRQQAVNAHLVHSIPTDDPLGIERYWHERFADRRYKGEWFVLTREDVAAFKRRRTFM